MWAFAKSVFYGALVGAAFPMMFTVSLALSATGGNWGWTVWFAFMPLAVAIIVVLVASVVLGLPLTFVLKRQQRERASAYVGAGAAAGFIIPILLYHWQSGIDLGSVFLAIMGSLSGSVTGFTWWLSARKPRL